MRRRRRRRSGGGGANSAGVGSRAENRKGGRLASTELLSIPDYRARPFLPQPRRATRIVGQHRPLYEQRAHVHKGGERNKTGCAFFLFFQAASHPTPSMFSLSLCLKMIFSFAQRDTLKAYFGLNSSSHLFRCFKNPLGSNSFPGHGEMGLQVKVINISLQV